MIEIKMGQTVELDNVLSFRGKLTQSEVEQVGRDMETKISDVLIILPQARPRANSPHMLPAPMIAILIYFN